MGLGSTEQKTLIACVSTVALLCAILLGYGSNKGFDLTDETFYLIWTQDPRAYGLTYQPFGYLLNPLFEFSGADLQTYRLAGFAVVAASGALLGYALTRGPFPPWVFGLYGAVAALSIFAYWIITPSYNSAANVGAILIIGGLLLILTSRWTASAVGTGALGAGLFMAAFSKPPLFAIALLLILAVAVFVRKRRAVVALTASIFFAGALVLLTVPPLELVNLLVQITESHQALTLPNSPSALPAKVLGDWLTVKYLLQAAAFASIATVAVPALRRSRASAVVALLIALAYLGGTSLRALSRVDLPSFLGLALMVTATAYLAWLRTEGRAEWPTPALLLCAPLAVALGTSNNHWTQLNFSVVFPFLALFALAAVDPSRWRRRAFFAIAIAGPPAVLLLGALQPYGLPTSIFRQNTWVDHPLAVGGVFVDQETASFVASAGGMAKGAPLIDLSGSGPGVAAVLGGRPPVLPWLPETMPTWPDVVWSGLSHGEREQLWVVGPVDPAFVNSRPAHWLAARKETYCPQRLAPMTFWGARKVLELWRPCQVSP